MLFGYQIYNIVGNYITVCDIVSVVEYQIELQVDTIIRMGMSFKASKHSSYEGLCDTE
jgi:hypothetical protein